MVKHHILLLSFCFLCISLKSQLSLSGQLRTRTELRSGLGNLVPKGSDPAFFTSQRTRLNLKYKWDRINFGVSVQDIRVWGQDASSISLADGNRLMLHEGWAEIRLLNKKDSVANSTTRDNLILKIGRQELSYDDVRLIGNLDWLQQARRHDMVLLKSNHKGWQADLGFAFNQHTDAFGISGTGYVPGNISSMIKNSLGESVITPAGLIPLAPAGNVNNNSSRIGSPVFLNPAGTNAASQQYKSFTSLYISKKIVNTKLSALFFNDNFGKYQFDSVGSDSKGYVYGRRFSKSGSNDLYDYSGTSKRYTYGLMINHNFFKPSGKDNLSMQAAWYRQSGEDRDGVELEAYHYTIAATYKRGKFSITPGYDVLSGNSSSKNSGKNNRFDPLYGTPHKHWGYMDYFYVGTGSPAGGLNNAYIKSNYVAGKFNLQADLHYFRLHKDMWKADKTMVDKELGTELDLTVSYSLNKITTIDLGYSIMKATSSMAFAKAQVTTDEAADGFRKTGHWAYLMINIRPDFMLRD